MNAKKKKQKRIYKKGLMNREERDAFNKEQYEEGLQRAKKSNKKLGHDIFGSPSHWKF